MKILPQPTMVIAFGITLFLDSSAFAIPMNWTSIDGKTINAEFIRVEGDSVVIQKDGKSFTIPFAKLKSESVAQAKKLGGTEEAAATVQAIDISPKNFSGKKLKSGDEVLGEPTAVLDEQFSREYKPNVPGISRIKLKRFSRATECIDVYYYFPKGSIKNLADAFSKIGLSTADTKVYVTLDAGGDNNEMLEKSKALGTISISSPLDQDFGRKVENIDGGYEAQWVLAGRKIQRDEAFRHDNTNADEDILLVSLTYEQSQKLKVERSAAK